MSTFGAGTVFGVFFAGWSADALGRKKTIAIGAVIALIAGIVQAATVHVGMLIAGRIVGGFAVGIMSACGVNSGTVGRGAVTDQCRYDDSNLQLRDRPIA